MLNFLIHHFVKNHEEVSSPDVRKAYGTLCGWLGILLNLLLFAGKLSAGIFSSSIAIMADAFNNLSDAGSSVITLIGFKMAGRKPDPGHPFGHGRIEYLSGLLVSLAIIMMAAELIKSSIKKIFSPEPVFYHTGILIILVLSIIVKLFMVYYNKKISRKIDSAAMKATAADSLSDAIATSAVLITTLIAQFTGLELDAYCGIIVGLFVLYTGFQAAKETISPLLGQSPDPDLVRRIENLVLSKEEVLGIHDLIVHDYGPGRLMVSLHAEVSADGDILALHDAIDLLEKQLQKELHCSAVIHLDPIANQDEETLLLRQTTMEQLKKIDPILTLHDFRVVKGPTHTNLIFDVVSPYSFRLSDSELQTAIQEALTRENATCYCVVQIDHSMVSHDTK